MYMYLKVYYVTCSFVSMRNSLKRRVYKIDCGDPLKTLDALERWLPPFPPSDVILLVIYVKKGGRLFFVSHHKTNLEISIQVPHQYRVDTKSWKRNMTCICMILLRQAKSFIFRGSMTSIVCIFELFFSKLRSNCHKKKHYFFLKKKMIQLTDLVSSSLNFYPL